MEKSRGFVFIRAAGTRRLIWGEGKIWRKGPGSGAPWRGERQICDCGAPHRRTIRAEVFECPSVLRSVSWSRGRPRRGGGSSGTEWPPWKNSEGEPLRSREPTAIVCAYQPGGAEVGSAVFYIYRGPLSLIFFMVVVVCYPHPSFPGNLQTPP